MLVTFEDGTTEQYRDNELAAGGQGKAYLSTDGQHVIKLYHQQPDAARKRVLQRIMNEYNVTRTDPTARELFAWPNNLSVQPRAGVRMNNVNARVPHETLQWWLSTKAFRVLREKHPQLAGNWLDRTRVAAQMARVAWMLHGRGLCHSDFSGGNFLANVALQRVVLIDLDALVIPDVLDEVILGTGEFMAPEIVTGRSTKPSIQSDLHSLAVLLYQLLLMHHPLRGPKAYSDDPTEDDKLIFGEKALYIEDPDDTSNHPRGDFNGAWLLGDEVETLFRQAFTIGLRAPEKRPTAAAWRDALGRMADQIIPCENPACPGRHFVLPSEKSYDKARDKRAVCPWCGTPPTRYAQVPVLRLYAMGERPGHFTPDKPRVVGWQARSLHRWHVRTGLQETSVTEPDERTPLAEIQYTQNRWVLYNIALPGLRATSGGMMRAVEPGMNIALEHQQQLILGVSEHARMAHVVMHALR